MTSDGVRFAPVRDPAGTPAKIDWADDRIKRWIAWILWLWIRLFNIIGSVILGRVRGCNPRAD